MRYLCKPICDELNPFEIIKLQTCVKNCDIRSILNHSCEINYLQKNNETKEEDSGKTEDEIKKQEDIKKKI